MGKIKGFAHIGLYASDLDKSIAFYTEILSFVQECSWERASNKVALLHCGDCALEAIQQKRTHL